MSTLEQSPDDAAALPSDLERVLAVGDRAISYQFQVAERLDAKARGQVTLAGAWFAVTQAVAAVAYSSKPGHTWLVLLLVVTSLGGGALVVTFLLSYYVWKPRHERELTHSGFRKLADEALHHDPALTEELVTYYQHVIGHRHKSNAERVKYLKRSQLVWFLAVALTFAELIVALLTRVVG